MGPESGPDAPICSEPDRCQLVVPYDDNSWPGCQKSTAGVYASCTPAADCQNGVCTPDDHPTDPHYAMLASTYEYQTQGTLVPAHLSWFVQRPNLTLPIPVMHEEGGDPFITGRDLVNDFIAKVATAGAHQLDD